jgi:deoxyribodipyrimidine photolyase-related protein
VTQEQAAQALSHFVSHLLPAFGDWQDAMKTGAPFLWHSLLSSSLNLGLLQAREVCAAAEAAYRNGSAPLNAVEGFIRQILGWREYVRGIYWLRMPAYQHSNTLQATRPLPAMYWGGKTPMRCMAQAIDDTRRHAYSHHIQRLMVTGNFALLAGIDPQQVHAWYLAVYVDAFEWVELPNTLGMSQYADGGVMASKPYVATGRYIDRMSDHCSRCRFDPGTATGPRACPYTTLYWDYLFRHERALAGNPRMSLQLRNAARYAPEARAAIVGAAAELRAKLANSKV